jgi:hypothetical protein
MTTIYLGGSFVSYEEPGSSHFSAHAREAVPLDEFEAENPRDVRPGPMLMMLVAGLIGLLVLGLSLADDGSGPRRDAASRVAARTQLLRQSNLAQRIGEAGEIRLVSKLSEQPTTGDPQRGVALQQARDGLQDHLLGSP